MSNTPRGYPPPPLGYPPPQRPRPIQFNSSSPPDSPNYHYNTHNHMLSVQEQLNNQLYANQMMLNQIYGQYIGRQFYNTNQMAAQVNGFGPFGYPGMGMMSPELMTMMALGGATGAMGMYGAAGFPADASTTTSLFGGLFGSLLGL